MPRRLNLRGIFFMITILFTAFLYKTLKFVFIGETVLFNIGAIIRRTLFEISLYL